MKKRIVALLAGMMLTLTVSAWATPIGSYTHNYGIGQVDPGGNDVLSTGYVTVSDQSTERFNDSFDFSGLNYSSIDHFDLTLTYSNIDTHKRYDTFWGELYTGEFWHVRPGELNRPSDFGLNPVGNTPASSTYTINSDFDSQFNKMLSGKEFKFWLAEETSGKDNFNLYSAKLDIYGTAPAIAANTAPVPEPGTMVLFGVGMLGLAVFGKRKMNKQA